MNPIALALVAAICVAAVASLTFRYVAHYRSERRPREVPRRIGALLIFFGLGDATFAVLAHSREEGCVLCMDCGEIAYQCTLLGFEIPAGAPQEPDDASNGYANAFSDVIGSHAHYWVRVGRHRVGLSGVQWSGVCTLWFRYLPMMQARDVARALVAKFHGATRSVQFELLDAFDGIHGSWWSHGNSVDESVTMWAHVWQQDHPDWP